MSYRLIALDIDGTIRANGRPPSERTRRTIARVREAGAIVTIATGRMFRSALRASAELDITSPIASSQGAHIADPVTHQVFVHHPMTEAMTLAALKALEPSKLEVVGYLGDQIYVRELTDWAEGYGQRNQVTVNVVPDLRECAPLGLTRFVVVGDEAEVQKLEAGLHGRFGGELLVTRSLPHFCEILHPSSGKDRALAWLCDRLDVRRDETIAFGNGYNDVEMLQWAALGVAVGGAVQEVVDVADVVSPPIEQDGVAQVLESLLKEGAIG